MSTYALIKDGIVDNTVEWDGDEDVWTPPEGTVAVIVPPNTFVGIGFTYQDGQFTDPDEGE